MKGQSASSRSALGACLMKAAAPVSSLTLPADLKKQVARPIRSVTGRGMMFMPRLLRAWPIRLVFSPWIWANCKAL